MNKSAQLHDTGFGPAWIPTGVEIIAYACRLKKWHVAYLRV